MSGTASERSCIDEMLGDRLTGRNSALVVHSAFSGLSRQGLRAEPFCRALLDALRGGTLLMPTMTWRTVTPANPVFDEMNTPSHTGVLSEVFRTGLSTHRSLHPTHSVAGTGPLAELLLSSHHEGTTPCAANSPYGMMRDFNAWVLMIGVGLECCTAIHHAEEVMAEEIYVRAMDEAEPYDLVDRNGRVHHVLTRRHRRVNRNFPKFGPALAALGDLAEGRIGDVPWTLVRLAGLYRTVFAALVRDRHGTLAEATVQPTLRAL